MSAPHPLILLGIAGAGLAGLAALSSKPRSRSEWLRSFESWAGPASEAEDKKVATADRMVRDALTQSKHLSGYKLRFIAQGSSINNTNVKQYSDLDLVVIHDLLWYRQAPGEGWPAWFKSSGLSLVDEHRKFRANVLQALRDTFLDGSVKEGNKSIKVSSTATTRVACDVVPSFPFRKLHPNANILDPSSYDEGIIFSTKNGEEVVNYPEQHLANGRNKNLRTGYRYKQIVRILKKMKENFREGQTLLSINEFPSSHEIETIVFNTPDSVIVEGDLFDGVVGTLKWLAPSLENSTTCNKLMRVNGFDALFPYWSPNATLLSIGPSSAPKETIFCKNFVQRALNNLQSP